MREHGRLPAGSGVPADGLRQQPVLAAVRGLGSTSGRGNTGARTVKGGSMDTERFDRLISAFTAMLSRRGLARALGLAATSIPSLAEANKKRQ